MTPLGLLWLARLMTLEPVQASLVGARLAGVPGLASELLDICETETMCTATSLHSEARPGQARVSGRRFWRRAAAAGWLDSCPAHDLYQNIPGPPGPTKSLSGGADAAQSAKRSKHGSGGLAQNIPSDAERWGVRGTHGLVAAYSVRWLGTCVDPAALDVPLLSAIVTARRLGELSSRYGMRTTQARAEAWRRGVGYAKRRSTAHHAGVVVATRGGGS